MRIAVVGSGVSGLVAGYLLYPMHDVTVFEADSRIGGHVNTIPVTIDGNVWPVDTGFIVYNERNYPLFTRLLARLGVETQASSMGFSVRCASTGLEYNGSSLRQLFVQPRNLLRPRYYRMLRDILRFNREAPRDVAGGTAATILGDYLQGGGYGREVRDHYLVPMGSALWSMPRKSVTEMPIAFFVQFFEQHGMLTVDDRPEWRVVTGGSDRYVKALTAGFGEAIRTRSPVHEIRRAMDHVRVNGERFDQVILACHADQALEMLADPSPAESEILGSFPYQRNEALLHTDISILPSRSRAWGAWNYYLRGDAESAATVTYDMNILQTLSAPETFCVSLNAEDIVDPARVLHRVAYTHPQYTAKGHAAQARRAEISGRRRTHYCGAYWGFGFHEDGVRSGVEAAKGFGADL